MEELGKLPRQNIEVEEIILGTMLVDKYAVLKGVKGLLVDYFYKDHNQRIYNAILELVENGSPVDILTVVQKLKSTSELEMVGGPVFISKLTSRVNGSANLESHIQIVRDCWLARKQVEISQKATTKGYSDTQDSFKLLHDTIFELESLNRHISTLSRRDMNDHADELLDQIKTAVENKGQLIGIDTSFSGLNKMLGGWQKSDLIIIAGRPGMGKTAQLVSGVHHQIEQGKRVAIFSLEMAGRQMLARLVAQDLDMPFTQLSRGKMSKEELEEVTRSVAKYRGNNLIIEDKAAPTPLEVKSKLIDFKPDIVYIDYLQLMSGSNKKYGNREAEVSDISRKLKELAKEFDCPIIAYAQLSRAVEQRGGNRVPKLSDLRESGGIEQDADVVMLLYRPEYYGIQEDGMRDGESIFIVAKQRNGEVGNCTVEFVKKTMKYQDFKTEEIETREAKF